MIWWRLYQLTYFIQFRPVSYTRGPLPRDHYQSNERQKLICWLYWWYTNIDIRIPIQLAPCYKSLAQWLGAREYTRCNTIDLISSLTSVNMLLYLLTCQNSWCRSCRVPTKIYKCHMIKDICLFCSLWAFSNNIIIYHHHLSSSISQSA